MAASSTTGGRARRRRVLRTRRFAQAALHRLDNAATTARIADGQTPGPVPHRSPCRPAAPTASRSRRRRSGSGSPGAQPTCAAGPSTRTATASAASTCCRARTATDVQLRRAGRAPHRRQAATSRSPARTHLCCWPPGGSTMTYAGRCRPAALGRRRSSGARTDASRRAPVRQAASRPRLFAGATVTGTVHRDRRVRRPTTTFPSGCGWAVTADNTVRLRRAARRRHVHLPGPAGRHPHSRAAQADDVSLRSRLGATVEDDADVHRADGSPTAHGPSRRTRRATTPTGHDPADADADVDAELTEHDQPVVTPSTSRSAAT